MEPESLVIKLAPSVERKLIFQSIFFAVLLPESFRVVAPSALHLSSLSHFNKIYLYYIYHN